MVFSMTASLVQLIVPDHLRGRVMSIYMVAFRGGMPLGSLWAGYAATLSSAPYVLAINGVLLALVAIVLSGAKPQDSGAISNVLRATCCVRSAHVRRLSVLRAPCHVLNVECSACDVPQTSRAHVRRAQLRRAQRATCTACDGTA